MQTRNIRKWKKPQKFFKIFLVFIVVLYIQLCYLALFKNVYGINMQAFAKNRNTYKTTIKALRGNIYAEDGTILAQTVTSYTVIAYLSASRTGTSKTPLHVVDKEKTARELAPLINMSEDRILRLLNMDLYQVELGPGGRGITELKKEEIEALNLPGIGFMEDNKRYYPNGDFASYIVGYAKKNDSNEIVGELGIESLYNDELKGTDGRIEQQQDRYGYKIPDTPEINVPATNGNDIYLTLDANIQRFLEDAADYVKKGSDPTFFTISVMEAKTGKILGSASVPSFNPNELNITNYENPLVSFAYEPGSVMKIFTYLCAMEKGTYKGSDTYESGVIKIGDTLIYDHNTVGWGRITYDLGFERSSNTAVATMTQNGTITKDDLHSCLTKYGYGKKTGINLPRELKGSLNFNYDVEVAAASYGQGITITPIQELQALSIIANDGNMITPSIVSKIVDSKTGDILYENKIEKNQVASAENVKAMRELMYNVVNSTTPGVTGSKYKIEGFDVIGKTGTAQIYVPELGRYSTDVFNSIFSFAGMFPKDAPDVIIFASIKQPKMNGSTKMAEAVVKLMKDIATYRNTFNHKITLDTSNSIVLEDYRGMDTATIKKQLEKTLDVVVVGSGDKIINQYPLANTTLLDNDKVFLVTNSLEIKVPDFKKWSRKDVTTFCNLANIEYEFEGYGYVVEQSIKANEVLKNSEKIYIKLKDKEI